jgi:hypothetical protein
MNPSMEKKGTGISRADGNEIIAIMEKKIDFK